LSSQRTNAADRLFEAVTETLAEKAVDDRIESAATKKREPLNFDRKDG
jgi:hypothetical protein